MNYEKSIINCSIFAELDDDKIALAMNILGAIERNYKKGECLFTAGGELKYFGLVLEGTVQVFTDDINGDRVMMANVSAGNTFGESLCFLEKKESPVLAFAAEDSRILWLSCSRLRESENAWLYNRFASMLAQRALDMNDRIQVLSKLTLREKILTLFSQYAHKSGGRTFSLPMSRESLAAYIGANRSALSRELCKMRDEGIIEFYKNSFKIL